MLTGSRPPSDPFDTGWTFRTRAFAALLSGLVLTAAFPPLDQRWVAVVGLVPLLLALRGVDGRRGALLGLIAGLGFFSILIYWISYFGTIAYVALVLLMVASWTAFGGFAARAVTRFGAVGRLVGVPLLFVGAELVRGWWPFGGFTWGALGSSQHSGGPTVHLAKVAGMAGVTLLLAAVNALIAEMIVTRSARARIGALLAAGALLIAPAAIPIGLAGPERGRIDIGVVQGNVPRERFTGLGRRGRVGPEDRVIVDNHIQGSQAFVADPPDLIVWPENSFDRDPRLEPDLFRPLQDLVARSGAPLMFGAILDAGPRFSNSNLLLTPDGAIAQRYDKRHLVPFGEYVPLQWARKLVPVLDRELPTDGLPGTRPVVFTVGDARIGQAICFESTYSELARDHVRAGAQIIVVSTNNASMGTSPAASQHLALSRIRAIENGRAVVHAAISGISAVIQPDGSIDRTTDLFRPAVLRANLPLTDSQTPFTRYGSALEKGFVLAALGFAVAPFALRRKVRRDGGGE